MIGYRVMMGVCNIQWERDGIAGRGIRKMGNLVADVTWTTLDQAR